MQTHSPEQLASTVECANCGNPEGEHYIDPPDCDWCPPGKQGRGGIFTPSGETPVEFVQPKSERFDASRAFTLLDVRMVSGHVHLIGVPDTSEDDALDILSDQIEEGGLVQLTDKFGNDINTCISVAQIESVTVIFSKDAS